MVPLQNLNDGFLSRLKPQRLLSEAGKLSYRGTGGAPILEEAVGKRLESLSAENVGRLRRELGPLTSTEQAIFNKVRSVQPAVTIRLSQDRLDTALCLGGIPAPATLQKISVMESDGFSPPPQWPQPYTPDAEDELYGAMEFVFATFSAGHWRGSDEYGSVVLHLRADEVLPRSWASIRSGWGLLREMARERGTPLEYHRIPEGHAAEARQRFSREVFVPADYSTAVGLEVVRFLRTQDDGVARELIGASPEQLPRLLDRHQLGYLELKIPARIPLELIARVEVPRWADPELLAQVRAEGVPVQVRSGTDASG